MALSFQQFKELRAKGLSTDQIIRFDSGEKPQQSQPTERPDRFQLQPNQPVRNFGKNLINDFADVGDASINFTKQLMWHPVQTAGNIASGVVNSVSHPIDTARDIKNNIMNFPNKPVSATLTALGTIEGGKSLVNPSKAIGKGIGKAATIPYNFAKDLIQTPIKAKKMAKEAVFNIGQSTRENIHNIEKVSKSKQTVVGKNLESVKKSYADLEKTLDYAAKKAGQKEMLLLQKELPAHFSKKSYEYGERLKGLIEGKDISIPADKVIGSMEDSLVEKGVLRFDPDKNQLILARSPRTTAETKIYNAYQNTKNLASNNPEAVIDAQDLIRTNNVIKPKYGKKWSPDEHMQAGLVEKLSQHINEAVPGIKALKKEFRPYLQWKQRVIQRMKPFAGEREAGQGAGIISKSGTNEISFDDKRMLAEIEKQLGRQVGSRSKTLRQGQQSTAIKRQQIEENSRQVLQDLKNKTSEEVFRLRQGENVTIKNINDSVENILSHYNKKKAVAGVGAAVVAVPLLQGTFMKYFLRHEILHLLKSGSH